MATAAGAAQIPRGRPVAAAVRPAAEVAGAKEKKEPSDESLEEAALTRRPPRG